MKLIGFANKFYTLWSYSEEELYTTVNNQPYKYGVKQIYSYIKNISFDLDKVKELYPNVKIDDDLKGKSASWSTEPKIQYPAECFHFGKYEGSFISECTDKSYLIWYFENGVYDERRTITTNRLIELGCYFYNDILFQSIELLNQYTDHIKKQAEISKMIIETYEKYKISGIFSYNFYNSLSSEGHYRDNSFEFRFNEFSQQCYAGYDYGLPLMNGKSKRIKNKVLEMEVITEEDKTFGNKYLRVLSIKSIKNI